MSDAPGAPKRLRCEYLENPLGLGETRPRLSWEIDDPRTGAVQTARQIHASASESDLLAGRADLWDSGKVDSGESIHVRYDGSPLGSRQRCWWRVRTWDARGAPSPWSAPAFWETGLLDAGEWAGEWISLAPRPTDRSLPCPMLRRTFRVERPVRRARLYATAMGLYEARINGRRVGDDLFTPGWTDYKVRIQYQTYDVAPLLRRGENAIAAVLGDGWACGYLIWENRRALWADRPALLAQLMIDYEDGSTETIATDGRWRAGTGPILESDIYNGETFDARLEMPGWDAPGFDDSSWAAATTVERPKAPLVAPVSQPVRRIEEIRPKEITEPEPGRFIFHLGQNMVGWVRLKVREKPGTRIVLRFGEMLKADGTLYTDNLRAAKATDVYICRGGGDEVFEPHFTFHGFQYAEVSGLGARPALDAVTGVVIHTAAPVSGRFECSSDMVNRLQSNIRWGQKGNFLDVPTDCPQRNERLGWTGDAQVFARTACFNLDVAAFYTKYCRDLADAQQPDGRFPDVAPNVLGPGGNCAWADAGVIVPWTVYLCYGDTAILDRHFDAMARWVDFMERESDGLIRPEYGYGDWLSIDGANPGAPTTPKSLIGTAYFALCARLVARAAELTRRSGAAARYRALEARVVAAFNREFVTPGGRVVGHSQTGYLLALGFDLLPPEKRPAAERHLLADLERRKWHLSTGFVGTPLLAPVLTRIGRTDAAYRLLMQDTYPSWLYPILQGATTMWERWNSYTKEGGFGDVGMNSFNHYAYGAIGQWLYATVAGLDLDPDRPGYRHAIIRPEPGGGLTWAEAELHTPYGLLRSRWELDGRRMTLALAVPANTTATLRLPVGSPDGLTIGGTVPEKAAGVSDLYVSEGRVRCELAAGRYDVVVPEIVTADITETR